MAKRLCTDFIDPKLLTPFLSCRLVAIDKNPGVRPIGIGEIVRRIIAKAALTIIKPDILDTVGCRQLCVGQMAGVESGVHSIRELYKDNEAVLLVDASNAFNSLNRRVALHNVRALCPSFATILVNCYREPSFIDGETILSQEGTTQGDPLSMPFYAVSTLPLINQLPCSVRQVWYADDAAAAGSVNCLSQWWSSIRSLGPGYGYFPSPSKTWLVVKEHCLERAREIFKDTQIQITSEGRPYLGSSKYIMDFMSEKVDQWIDEIDDLSKVANSALTHGLLSRWTYICRTVPHIQEFLEKLEGKLLSGLIPKLTGRPPPDLVGRSIFALPAQFGCLGIPNLVQRSGQDFTDSLKICNPIVEQLMSGECVFDYQCELAQSKGKLEVEQERWKHDKANLLRDHSVRKIKGDYGWLERRVPHTG